MSSHIIAGSSALTPIQIVYDSSESGVVNMGVYAAGEPPLTSGEIVWRDPRGQRIPPSSLVSYSNTNRQITIRNLSVEDGGRYEVAIVREVVTAVFVTLQQVDIQLNVQGRIELSIIKILNP